METKKISFGFMKTKKQDKPIVAEKKDYIECVEEKSIKVVGGEIEEKLPLVIQMKPNTLITAEKLKQIAAKVENFEDEKPEVDNTQSKAPENETLEQMAARELLEEARKIEVLDKPNLVVPIPAQPVLEGKKESTLDDYESIPIQDFGMAMLRGMGWTPGKELSKYKQPQLRPKGLGLGADKVVKENQKKSSKENDEDLAIVKKAYVKITTGKYAGFYGQVVSLDEDNGRALVDIPIKKETVSLSEFMMQPVSKSEYDKLSKVINADSYEEYKRKETNTNSPTNIGKESRQKYASDRKHDKEKSNGSSQRTKSSQKYSSNEDINSLDSDRAGRESPTRPGNEKGKSSKERRDRYLDDEKRKKSSRKYNSSESLNSSDPDRSRRRSPNNGYKYRKDKSLKTSKEGRNKDVDQRRNKSKYSSNESLYSSESDCRGRSSSDRRRHKKNSKHSKEKKDIDKKRKGKKKKRDRDRSPNYKKCRK